MSPSRHHLDPVVLSAIVAGGHGDPFAVLGPQMVDDSWQVRALLPGANSVELVDISNNTIAPMTCIHEAGFFIGTLPARQRYRLRVIREDQSSVIDDAYAFESPLGALDLHLMGEGAHLRLYEKLGAHVMQIDGIDGVHFAVWAPNASRVSVIGDFNGWNGLCNPMRRHPSNGVWDIFVPGVNAGTSYKFELLDALGRMLPYKADPFARRAEPPPGNASIVYRNGYRWQDDAWMSRRPAQLALDRPMSTYEVHLGSWRRRVEEGDRWLSYRELADQLVDYVADMGYTAIELMPVTEHPFDGSWGYQPIGLFAPTWRFGQPDDFKYFVDRCHQAGLAVIVDWVPAHFPRDAHGLGQFDGTALYEHADPRKGAHTDWGTLIFNYGRNEVINYLLASALLWIESYHIDGLRVDAVASMLYLDYSREEGEWLPNEEGGRENLEAVAFLRRLNEVVHQHGAVTIAEESTAWPMVSRPTTMGGLGFSYKWNMGWMHDSLKYIGENPVHRKHHHDKLTFGLLYAFNENFVLPISHDEVVHGKGSMLERMPGDRWQRFANLRAYYGFMFSHPGKKLLFMGCEFGQWNEWSHDRSLDWHLLEEPEHAGVKRLVRDLNRVYTDTPPLYEIDFEPAGFQWLIGDDSDNSVYAWLRHARNGAFVVVVANFTPVPRRGYRIGVPLAGDYTEIINTDASVYGGSGVDNQPLVASEPEHCHGQPQSLVLNLPPLATLILSPHGRRYHESGV